MLSSAGKQTLNNVIWEYHIKDLEEFKNKVYDYLGI